MPSLLGIRFSPTGLELAGYAALAGMLAYLAIWMPPPIFYVLPLAPIAFIALWQELPGGTVASLVSLAAISLILALEPDAAARARSIAQVWPLLPVYLALGPLLGALAARDRQRSRVLRRQARDLQAQWRRAEQFGRALRAVSEAGAEIASTLDLQQTLLLVVEKAAQTLSVHSAAVFRFDTETERYEAVVSHNLSEAEVRHLTFHFDEGVPGWVVRHRSELLIEDAAADARIHPRVAEAGIRSVLALPLQARDQVVGVLCLYAREARCPFGEAERELARIFAQQSAVALENVRLLSGWRGTAERLEQRMEGQSRALRRLERQLAGAEGNGEASHAGPELEEAPELGPLCVGGLCIDPRAHRVTLGDQEIELTPTEFKLLLTLAQRPGEAVGYVELARQALDYEPERWEAPDLIKYHVYGLRRKIEPDPTEPHYVVNVRGVGYRLPQPASTERPPFPN